MVVHPLGRYLVFITFGLPYSGTFMPWPICGYCVVVIEIVLPELARAVDLIVRHTA